MRRLTREDQHKMADALESAVSKSISRSQDPAFISQTQADGHEIGRFPGVIEDGVKIGKRQHSTDNGGYNTVITHHKNAWSTPPFTDEEKAIYEGWHVHNEGNPYGLHTHFKGGTLGGSHSHGPANNTGKHTHKDVDMTTENVNKPISISGDHHHSCPISPDGGHRHSIQDYGGE